MGGWFSKSLFTKAEIQLYEDVTYLRKKEIEYLLTKFMRLAPEKIKANREYRVPLPELKNFPEFGANPFG